MVPKLDTRVLISIKSGIDIPVDLKININGKVFVFPIEILGGINACFLYKRGGHQRKDYPIITHQKKPNINTEKSNPNLSFARNTMSNAHDVNLQTHTDKIVSPKSSIPPPKNLTPSATTTPSVSHENVNPLSEPKNGNSLTITCEYYSW